MKKGFTLIELLAVIIIMSILLSLGVPALINNLTEKKLEAKERMVNIIEKSSKSYATDYEASYPTIVSMSEVCGEYFSCPVIDPVTNEEMDGMIYIDADGVPVYIEMDEDEAVLIFNPKGGTVSPNYKIIKIGEGVGSLPIPVSGKTSESFMRWETNESTPSVVTSASIFTNEDVSSSRQIYLNAKYDSTTYILTYETKEGTSFTSDSNFTCTGDCTTVTKSIRYGEAYGAFPTISNYAGHNLIGYYTKEIGGTKIEETSKYNFAKNKTLYARWDVNRYAVTLNANGGYLSPSGDWLYNTPSTVYKEISYLTNYGNLLTPVRNGYTFMGWYTDTLYTTLIEDSTPLTTMNNHTLYAKWQINSYVLTFDPNEGTVNPSSKTVTYNSQYGDLPTPVRTGYTFTGWYTAINDGIKLDSTTVMGTNNLTLYAHWTATSYVLTFDPNEGTVSPTTKNVLYNTAYGELPTPTRSGYSFSGWYTLSEGGVEVTSSTLMGSSDTTIHAQWKSNTVSLEDTIKNLVGTNTSVTSGTGGLKKYTYDSTNTETSVAANITKTDYRYYGSSPNNYIKFSGSDEVWRIIGIVDGKVKVIREESFKKTDNTLLTMSWDSSASGVNSGWGVNEWSQADMMTMLNNYYYGTSNTCTYCNAWKQETCTNDCATGTTYIAKMPNAIKNMIDTGATWYIGSANTGDSDAHTIKAADAYKNERGTTTGKICSSGDNCNDTVERTTTWAGAVGLMSLSDYAYASDLSQCDNALFDYYNTNCKLSNWLYQGHTSEYQWTVSSGANSSNASDVWYVDESGCAYRCGASDLRAVRPSAYLKSSVSVESGTGTSTDPYILIYES